MKDPYEMTDDELRAAMRRRWPAQPEAHLQGERGRRYMAQAREILAREAEDEAEGR